MRLDRGICGVYLPPHTSSICCELIFGFRYFPVCNRMPVDAQRDIRRIPRAPYRQPRCDEDERDNG